MNRLESELHRLYLHPTPSPGDDAARPLAPPGSPDAVRAMVMELTRPPSWEVLSRVWHGVQAELELPAPAIAVSGVDGLQLWFSLEQAITAARAHAFLEWLRARFMPDVDSRRIRLMPGPDPSAPDQALHARPVPARSEETGNWSAFVAPDLAPVFADTPWLDIPPNEEGQAMLLRGLRSMKPAAFEEAWKQLVPVADRRDAVGAVEAVEALGAKEAKRAKEPTHALEAIATGVEAPAPPAPPPPLAEPASEEPKRFLLRVMNDDTVALALRIEAAKALLRHGN